MSEAQRDNEQGSAAPRGPAAQETGLYYYESAGIVERKGQVPIWLWVVAVSLLAWGFYYLVTYWNAPVVSV